MAYVVRGVQLFSGLSAPDEWGEGPLRRISSVCGLCVGEQSAVKAADGEIDKPDHFSRRHRVRLATLEGHRVDRSVGFEVHLDGDDRATAQTAVI